LLPGSDCRPPLGTGTLPADVWTQIRTSSAPHKLWRVATCEAAWEIVAAQSLVVVCHLCNLQFRQTMIVIVQLTRFDPEHQ